MARNTSSDSAVDPTAQPDPPKGRLKQLVYAYRMTKDIDPRLPVAVFGWGAGVGVVLFALLFVLLHGNVVGIVFAAVFGILGGGLTALSVLSRRVQRSAYSRIDGQPGAAAAVLEQSLKRGWAMTPAVQFNRQQDLVHRLIGRAGILLIAEGDPNRVGQLVTAERKAIARYLGPDVEVEALTVGDDTAAGQVPLSKLSQTVTRRGLRGRSKLTQLQVSEYAKRLAAISSGPMANLPKGPIPRGGRIPRGNIR
ncbi:MAG TPA: DUF4191 domain-containing protein [Actinocrinis sp.]|jgi:hypothetical protein|uniref:DUF4191 domain-containing protein n=1 Tax=Actinocrinis sp. TaxID=1920516 RepID=UPI002DDD7A18|nr:DUF4191 domain-containing protein [Actinocrinis sp.]HEV3172600.1 DUF4191 domain-containing protein [Actinocrinis sp.]